MTFTLIFCLVLDALTTAAPLFCRSGLPVLVSATVQRKLFNFDKNAVKKRYQLPVAHVAKIMTTQPKIIYF